MLPWLSFELKLGPLVRSLISLLEDQTEPHSKFKSGELVNNGEGGYNGGNGGGYGGEGTGNYGGQDGNYGRRGGKGGRRGRKGRINGRRNNGWYGGNAGDHGNTGHSSASWSDSYLPNIRIV